MSSPSTQKSDDQPRPPRYGDYVELFWDLKPDEAIDVEHPFVLARLLTQADPETIWRLVPVEVIRRQLPDLPILEHTRTFWKMVLDALDQRASTRSATGA